MGDVRSMIPYLIPVVILELILMFFAIKDLVSRSRVNGPKWAWALVIVLIQILGPIGYFVFGRRDE